MKNSDLSPLFYGCLKFYHNRQIHTGMPFSYQELNNCANPKHYSQPLYQQHSNQFNWWQKPIKPPKKKSFCTILSVNEIEYDNPFIQKYFLSNLLPSLYENIDAKNITNFILNNFTKDSLSCIGQNTITNDNDVSPLENFN